MKKICLYIAMGLLIASCQKNDRTEIENLSSSVGCIDLTLPSPAETLEMVKFSPPVIKDDAVEETINPESAQQEKNLKKIIKDGTLFIEAVSIEKAKTSIDKSVKESGGYYEKENFSNFDTRISYALKIRIPSQNFESFLLAAEKAEGRITSKTINARDVTEEYTDISMRLKSKRLFRERYKELLMKANKVVDILAIEENVRTLQEEIESQEGRIKFLDDQVTYSTLEITLFKNNELKQVVKTESFKEKLLNSLFNGWISVVDFTLWSIKQWPFIFLLLLSFFIIRGYIKRKRTKI